MSIPQDTRRHPARQLLLALALALLGLTLAAPPAAAQDAFSDFWGSIFGVRRARPPEPRRWRRYNRPRRHHQVNTKAAPSAPVVPSAANQQPPSFFVLVIGDSEGGRLAQGLAQAFAGDPRVAIVNKTKLDSGLVRDDFYDWPAQVKKLLDGPQHYNVAVMQIGINDNQTMHVNGAKLAPLSKPFNEIYAKRVQEIADAFRDKKIPLIWVGLPIMRSARISHSASTFNDIDREYAGAVGAKFVDLWEAFSDVNSEYKAWGPDVNGNIVRLRSSDGIHFNKAGARKAAHFVTPGIRNVLKTALTSAPATPTTPSQTPSAVTPGTPPAGTTPAPKPIAGKVEPLTAPATSPGGVLAQLPISLAAPRPVAAAQPGRADDFPWPPKQPKQPKPAKK